MSTHLDILRKFEQKSTKLAFVWLNWLLVAEAFSDISLPFLFLMKNIRNKKCRVYYFEQFDIKIRDLYGEL